MTPEQIQDSLGDLREVREGLLLSDQDPALNSSQIARQAHSSKLVERILNVEQRLLDASGDGESSDPGESEHETPADGVGKGQTDDAGEPASDDESGATDAATTGDDSSESSSKSASKGRKK